MSKNKQVLGRGLDALLAPSPHIEEQAVTESVSSNPVKAEEKPNLAPAQGFFKTKLSKIEPNPFQPRKNFEPEAMEELKKSIVVNGLIQPITIRKIGEDQYQLISGERRFKAFTELGFSEIPAYILEVLTDEAMLAMALIENIQREQLNPVEVGLAYQRLLEECNLTHEDIANRVGKDRSTITNSIRLLKLPQKIQDCLIHGTISMGHARALVNVPDIGRQLAILDQIISQNLSVRKVEELVKNAILSAPKVSKRPKIQQNSNDPANIAFSQFEDNLRRLLGTKVLCKQKADGTGEIVLEYYSQAEFERLIELLYEINNSNS